MATFYEEMQNVAVELIDEFGLDGTLVRYSKDGEPNDRSFQATDEFTCRAVVLNYEEKQIDGTRITVRDRNVLVSTFNVSFIITTQDRIVLPDHDGGLVEYEIINAVQLRPAALTLYWSLQART